MKHREQLDLKEISPSQIKSSFFDKLGNWRSMFKKNLQENPHDTLVNEQDSVLLEDNQSFNNNQDSEDNTKDWLSLLLFLMALFGLESFLVSSYTPAFGKENFLGLDIAFLWYFFKVTSMLIGGFWLSSLIFKIRGDSYILNKFFRVVPDFIKYKLSPISIVFISTLILNVSLLLNYPQLFKTTTEWNKLELAKIDSPSPLKRAEFSGLIFQDEGKSKQFIENIVTPKINQPSQPSLLDQYPNDSKPSPHLKITPLSPLDKDELVKQEKNLDQFKELKDQVVQQMLDNKNQIDLMTKMLGKNNEKK